MAKEVKLSEIIIPKLHAIVSPSKLDGVEDIIITSGRIGSKSSAQSINVDWRAINSPGAHVMMRKNHNKINSTVYKETLRAFGRLGIRQSAYEAKKKPPLIKIKKNGSVIYFAGSDSNSDTKGMIDENFPIETVTIDEVDEFFKMGFDRGKEELDNIKATFVRGNDSDEFKMFYLFNPPTNPKAPVMKWLNEKKYIHDKDNNIVGLNPRTLHIHVDYRDVPVEWIGKATIRAALETKRIDEDYYNWLWLGQCVGVKDVIFYMFDEKEHVIKYEGQYLTNIGIGVDYGQKNATTFNAFGIDIKEKRLQGIASYRHSGRESKRMKSPSEYAQDMLEFIKLVEERTNENVKFIVIDPSATGFAEEVRKVLNNNGMGRIAIHKANNAVNEGITRMQVLIREGALVLDPSMKGPIEEFGLYKYDPRSVERGNEVPVKEDDHDMDAIRYLVMHVYEQIKSMRKIKDGMKK